MRACCVSLLAVAAMGGATPVPAAERLDELFAAWREAQISVRSLVVEFAQESRCRTSGHRWKCEGTFKVLRTPDGNIFASYQLRDKKQANDMLAHYSGLLSGGTVYLLDHGKKEAAKFPSADQDLFGFLERKLNPFVVLLDRKRAEAKHRLGVVKQDKWYTYLTMEPKGLHPSGLGTERFVGGRVVLMNRATDGVPKDMPTQLFYGDGTLEYTYEISAWRVNGADAPKLEEFMRPEDRPGWKVGPAGWPFKD